MQQEVQRLETIGLIGPGYWGSKFITALLKRNYHVLVADSKTNVSEFLRQKDFNKVFVMTPVSTHFDLVYTALLNGKHVFCEKNFTQEHWQADVLVALAEQKDLQLMVDYIYSFNPELNSFIPSKENNITILQWGRFRKECVSSILGSHALGVMDVCVGLKQYQLVEAHARGDDYPIAARLFFEGPNLFNIEVGLDCTTSKQRYIQGESKICLDYKNGIDRALDLFLSGHKNTQTILSVSKNLQRFQQIVHYS